MNAEPILAGWVECPCCGGEGQVYTGYSEISRFDGSVMENWIRCEECNGTGSVEEDAPQIDEDEREFADPTVAA